MKICIITQPLHSNYGGLLQAYALQQTLKNMGHEVVTARDGITRRRIKFPLPYFLFYAYKRYIRGDRRFNPYQFMFRSFGRDIERQREYKAVNTAQFIDKNISTIDLFSSPARSAKEIIANFDIVIVGSDQVWRAEYADPRTYFLDFASSLPLKRIAYAASFGLDRLEGYSNATIKRCRELAHQFNAISVREKSGTKLLAAHFDCRAEQVADPTLLLDIEEYKQLISNEIREPQIVSYILDPTAEKSRAIEQLEHHFSLATTSLLPHNESQFIAPEQWLEQISQARFIITDSFHGAIFAILFHRDFVVIDNAERGSERFTSLLEPLALLSRRVKDANDITPKLLNTSIDYTPIDPIIEKWRTSSLEWLTRAINNNALIHNS